MADLVYHLLDAKDHGETRHPDFVISGLGIKFREYHGFPAQDVVLLKDCTNIPDELPAFIKRRHIND
jgi:hypothetical protein